MIKSLAVRRHGIILWLEEPSGAVLSIEWCVLQEGRRVWVSEGKGLCDFLGETMGRGECGAEA